MLFDLGLAARKCARAKPAPRPHSATWSDRSRPPRRLPRGSQASLVACRHVLRPRRLHGLLSLPLRQRFAHGHHPAAEALLRPHFHLRRGRCLPPSLLRARCVCGAELVQAGVHGRALLRGASRLPLVLRPRRLLLNHGRSDRLRAGEPLLAGRADLCSSACFARAGLLAGRLCRRGLARLVRERSPADNCCPPPPPLRPSIRVRLAQWFHSSLHIVKLIYFLVLAVVTFFIPAGESHRLAALFARVSAPCQHDSLNLPTPLRKASGARPAQTFSFGTPPFPW